MRKQLVGVANWLRRLLGVSPKRYAADPKHSSVLDDEEEVPPDALVTMVVRYHAIVQLLAAAQVLLEEYGHSEPPELLDAIGHIQTALYANCYDGDGCRPKGPIANPDLKPP